MGICLTVKSVIVEEEDICRKAEGTANFTQTTAENIRPGRLSIYYRTYLSIAQSSFNQLQKANKGMGLLFLKGICKTWVVFSK